MSQGDFDITTGDANTGVTYRAAVNAMLQALASLSSGAGAPGTSYPYQIYIDTTASPAIFYIRKALSAAWVRCGYIDPTTEALVFDNIGVLTHNIRDASRNLVIVNNTTNPTYQVDIDADEIMLQDATPAAYTARSVNLTVDITASGANGLDTGAENPDKWYYIWVIYNSTTTTVAGLLSESLTAPTMPSGYTYKALVGAVRNASGDFGLFLQRDNSVVIPAVSVFSGETDVAYDSKPTFPIAPMISRILKGVLSMSDTTGSGSVFLASTSSGLGEIELSANITGTHEVSVPVEILKEAQVVWFKMLNATSGSFKVHGWEY
jgi:hypothetical protein